MLSLVKRFIAVLVLACSALALPLQAQQPSWTLRNISNTTLHFETFDYQRGTWKQQMIYPNQSVTYTMSWGTNEGKFHINTKDRGFVEYQVQAGQSYTVGWDKGKGVWDLKFAAAAQPYANGNTAPPARGSYSLHNDSNAQLNFETMDPARGTWKLQTVQPWETKTFTMSSPDVPGKIRIATDGRGHVEYDVRNGWKYKLVWSDQKGVWDFLTVQKAGQACTNCRY